MSKHIDDRTVCPRKNPKTSQPPDDERGRKRRRRTNPGRYVPFAPNRNCNCRHIGRVPTKSARWGLAARSPQAGAPGDTLARQLGKWF